MRKKIVKTVPIPNTNTEWVYYADGTRGIRGEQGVGNPEANSIADQGRAASPVEWSGEAMDDNPATHGEIGDIEAMLEAQRQRASEDYGRDQRFRDFSNTMGEVEKHPEGSQEANKLFEQAIKDYPDYLKEGQDGQVMVPAYFLPEKKGQ